MRLFIQKNQKKILDTAFEEKNDVAVGALLDLPVKFDLKYIDSITRKAPDQIKGVLLDYKNKNTVSKGTEGLEINDNTGKPKTLAEWKKEFKLTNIGADEICVGTYKGYDTSVTIPEMIGKRKVVQLERTFSGNNDIKNVYLQEGLREIGMEAFDECSSLEFINLPSTLETIESYAFRGCVSLNEIIIPEKVTSISNNAFEKCVKLTEVTIPDSVTVVGDETDFWYSGDVFSNCINLKRLKLSARLTALPDSFCRGCTALKEIELPIGLESIDRLAFADCSNLEKVVIHKGVREIDSMGVFSGCNKLTIFTEKGSYAEEYAKENGIPVVNIEE